MTVIEVSVGRQRPGLVGQEKYSAGEIHRERAKGGSSGAGFMQQIRGCGFGDFLAGDSIGIRPAVEKDHGHDQRSRFFRVEGESASAPRKTKISSRIDLPQVRGRRKSRWKLKFHHQALPPEYLRHYKQQERKRRQTETKKSGLFKSKIRKIVKKPNMDSETKNVEGREGDGSGRKENADRAEEGAKLDKEHSSGSSLATQEAGEGKGEEGPVTGDKEMSQEIGSHGCEGSEPEIRVQKDVLRSSISSISQLNIDITQNKAFLENLLTNQIEINRVDNVRAVPVQPKCAKPEEKPKLQAGPPSAGKVMNVSDLPYMGEITLDGIKPRRGRKPKKADICHLIYKNYGQVFPGSPGRSMDSKNQTKWKSDESNGWNEMNSSQSTKVGVTPEVGRRLESPLPSVPGLINHSEVQNRIINSLLEKRLTQERRCKRITEGTCHGSEEPLNLCIRDLQSLKIKLSRKHGNVYETRNADEDWNEVKKEIINVDNSESEKGGGNSDEDDEEDDLAPFNLVTTELRESSDEDNCLNFSDQITLTKIKSGEDKCHSVSDESSQNSYWTGNNLLLHPVPPSLLCYPRSEKSGRSEALARKPFRCKPDGEGVQSKRVKTNPNAANVITKRKRSAIFIPPVPAENTSNPTTEVSICKFKFTGGAKPSLQEKKMLSVDSGGNFRYYSGTGDKSMRGYEYFARESLRQCQENTGCSPSGVFLAASAMGSGEKIPEEIGHSGFFDSDFPIRVSPSQQRRPRVKARKRGEFRERYQTLREQLCGDGRPDAAQSPDDSAKEDVASSDESADGIDVQDVIQRNYLDGLRGVDDSTGSDVAGIRNKKPRKSKKSIAREKLEQTFKEKGFLIQTQQLESAEGATYCKFRQLRKFTRYLFRSWKDYLPGNVRDLSVDAGVDGSKILELPDPAAFKAEPFCDNQGKNI